MPWPGFTLGRYTGPKNKRLLGSPRNELNNREYPSMSNGRLQAIALLIHRKRVTMPLLRFRAANAKMFRRAWIVSTTICWAIGTATISCQQAPATRQTGPQIAGCPVFPADNVWNLPIDKLPLDPHSKDYVGTVGADAGLHPDFGTDARHGIPINIIDSKVRPIRVTFQYS